MKLYTSIAIIATSVFHSKAHAQVFAVDPYFSGNFKVTEMNLTVTLVKTSEVPLLDLKDENGFVIKPVSKTFENQFTDSTGKEVYEGKQGMVKNKYSNLEILNDLKKMEIIDSVTGWSVVFLYDNTDMGYYNQNTEIEIPDSVDGVYLKRKTTSGYILKDVSEYVDFSPYDDSDDGNGEESGENYVTAFNYLESNNYETEQYSYKEASSTIGIGSFSLNIEGNTKYLPGACSNTITWDSLNQIYKISPTIRGLMTAFEESVKIDYDNDGNADDSYSIMASLDGSVSASFVSTGDLKLVLDAIDYGNFLDQP